jgi:hypothetical protein
MADSHRVRGSVPWAGVPTGLTSNMGRGVCKSKTHLEQLHSRRSVGELEALLAERLAELRADPPLRPTPYPRDEVA